MSEFDFQPYLEFVRQHYGVAQGFYTPTDAILPLQVRSVVKADREERGFEQKAEQFPVLAGLRQYAIGEKREHVLLAGRPGSGKSTALRQLAVELAADGMVPVLVQLKGDRTVLEAIANELERGGLELEPQEIKRLLRQNQFVLLLDGVNEIPTEPLRRQLQEFRETYSQTPMIFTTRDLSLGGDLGIEKRLEMQPLSESQMRKFVGKYLPEQGEQLLGQLHGKLPELAETPLLLKMLCDVFNPETGKIPESTGELFQWFDRDYERIKKGVEYVPVSENFWLFKSQILQHLAFTTIKADWKEKSEPAYTFSRDRAASILEKWLQSRGMADSPTKVALWVKDLVNYHLLQDAAEQGKIEFHHQLFQEYYAAEWFCHHCDWQLLASHVIHSQWREVILMSTELGDQSEKLCKLIQIQIENHFAHQDELQEFLVRLYEKSQFFGFQKPADRALLFEISTISEFRLTKKILGIEKGDLKTLHDFIPFLAKAFHPHMETAVRWCIVLLEQKYHRESCKTSKDSPNVSSNFHILKTRAIYFSNFFKVATTLAYAPENPQLIRELQELNATKDLTTWRKGFGKLIEQYYKVSLLENQNNNDLNQQVQKYYELNIFLIECLNKSTLPDIAMRRKIENRLLLPISEIQQRQAQDQGFSVSHPHQPQPSQQNTLDTIATGINEINQRTKQIMAEQPSRTFHVAGNYIEKVEGDYIEHNYAPAANLTNAEQQLNHILTKLRTKYPDKTDTEIFEMLLNGFNAMPTQNPKNWQQWKDLLSLLFAGGFEAAKLAKPEIGIPIEILKRLYEIWDRNRKQLPGA